MAAAQNSAAARSPAAPGTMLHGAELVAWATARDETMRKQYSKKDLKNVKGGRISMICPGLFLGNRDGAADTEGLARRGVTALVNVGGGKTSASTSAMLEAARARTGTRATADAAGGSAAAVTPASLRRHWQTFKPGKHPKVVGFYGHHPGKAWGEFSNFYSHGAFEFVLPACCQRDGFPSSARVEFAEKAIMLCKAAAMGDRESFDAIARARTAVESKQLGRGVYPWNQAKWDVVVCQVAESACTQKFAKVAGLAQVLLQTGDKLIAEATSRDRIWGIGLDQSKVEVQFPAQWRGTNILGWALMQARDHVRANAPTADPRAKQAKRRSGESPASTAASRATHQDGNYLKVQVEDRDGVPLAPHFGPTADFVHSHCGGAAGGAVFVHCSGGVHRSPAMVICYLMKHRGLSLMDAQAVCALGRPQMRCSPRDAAHHWAELEAYSAALSAAREGTP